MLLGLQLGLPIVATPAAAKPFGMTSREHGAALGASPAKLAAAAAGVLADGAARAALGAAAKTHFARLLASARPLLTRYMQQLVVGASSPSRSDQLVSGGLMHGLWNLTAQVSTHR